MAVLEVTLPTGREESMATIIHETFGINEKKGLQGYQFNYPHDGCIFDKTNQRFVEYIRGVTDEFMMHKFLIECLFFPKRIESLKWQAIKKIEEPTV